MQYFGVELPWAIMTPDGKPAWRKNDLPALLALAE